MQSNKGVTLVEVIIYIALLGGIAVFLSNFLLYTVNIYQRARSDREIISNARLILETINKSVAQANEVYFPSSKFNDDAGQLSLITQLGAQTEHTTAYLDFWVDNGRVWTKAEGASSAPLSAATVRISRLNFERILQGLNRDAVKIVIQVDSVSKFPSSITLNSTMAVRGNY